MNKIQLPDSPGILVSRTDKIGDVILSLPVITELKRLYPDSKIYFLISNRLDNLIENYPGISEIIYIENYTTGTLTQKLKALEIDAAVMLFPEFQTAKAIFKSNIKYRIGTAYRWFSWMFNYRLKEHRKYSVKHEADYNLDLLKFFANDINYNKEFHFTIDSKEWEMLKVKFDIKENFVIIHPGSRASAINLPSDKMISIAEYINKNYPDYEIIITGSEEEKDKFSIFENIKAVKNLCGQISLRELLIITDNCSLFIANSTGPLHIAGALNKKIIAFYPNSVPMTPVRWAPLSNNAIIMTPQRGDDMNEIESELIFQNVKSILDEKKN